MIHYSLKCDDDHGFESWFASAQAFDTLQRAGQISCPVCGSAHVEKALMAPSVRPARSAPEPDRPRPLKAPTSEVEQAIAALRRQVEENADYVGLNFATEARAIHDGTVEARSIYGEARPDEARKLIEDGVPVAPLPFLPQRKAN
jgi:hypothetical protein